MVPGNDLVIYQIAEHTLGKLVVIFQGFYHIIHQLSEYIICIRILTGYIQPCGIHPVAGNSAVDIISEADGTVPPRLVLGGGLVNLILLDDTDRGL